MVVVGLQESHLQWYGLELRSDPPSPLCTTILQWGVKTGTDFPARKTVLWRSELRLRLHSLGVLCPAADAQCPSVHVYRVVWTRRAKRPKPLVVC